jgi:hypothetical protein
VETKKQLSINQDGKIITVTGTDFLGHPAYNKGKWIAQIDTSKDNVVTNIDVYYPSKNLANNLARNVQCDDLQDERRNMAREFGKNFYV